MINSNSFNQLACAITSISGNKKEKLEREGQGGHGHWYSEGREQKHNMKEHIFKSKEAQASVKKYGLLYKLQSRELAQKGSVYEWTLAA